MSSRHWPKSVQPLPQPRVNLIRTCQTKPLTGDTAPNNTSTSPVYCTVLCQTHNHSRVRCTLVPSEGTTYSTRRRSYSDMISHQKAKWLQLIYQVGKCHRCRRQERTCSNTARVLIPHQFSRGTHSPLRPSSRTSLQVRQSNGRSPMYVAPRQLLAVPPLALLSPRQDGRV